MKKNYVYQLVATILPNGMGGETVQHDLGVFSTLKNAKKCLGEFVKDCDFFCPIYSYSIAFLPFDDDWDYECMRYINIYSPDGKLQIKEFNFFTCGGGWSEELNFHIRAYIDVGPQKKAYFVLFNHWRLGLATKCARISFLEPKYELGTSFNKSVWFLSEQEKSDLCAFLNQPKHSYDSIWRSIIAAFNNEVQADDDSRMLPEDLPMPDYRRLSNG